MDQSRGDEATVAANEFCCESEEADLAGGNETLCALKAGIFDTRF